MEDDMDYREALERFIQENQERINEYFEEHLSVLNPDELSVDEGGQAYDRIVSTKDEGRGQRRVFCFIKKRENSAKGDRIGDILYPAGWSGPAKHARGNIFDASRHTATTRHGARRLRR